MTRWQGEPPRLKVRKEPPRGIGFRDPTGMFGVLGALGVGIDRHGAGFRMPRWGEAVPGRLSTMVTCVRFVAVSVIVIVIGCY